MARGVRCDTAKLAAAPRTTHHAPRT